MKKDFPQQSIEVLCRLFGKTRHAYYDHQWRFEDDGIKTEFVLQQVLDIRKSLPRLGTAKIHHKLKPFLEAHQIKMGRDCLYNLMREYKLDIRRRKRYAATTDSHHWMHKYSNLISEIQVQQPESVWVSDITYIRLPGQWAYLSLITDAYSRKIMGYSLRTDLSVKGCIEALKMAIDNRQCFKHPLIHHSDRGAQYCCREYVDLLIDQKIAISMTENGSPYENAIAERINGILKTEFNLHSSLLGYEQTKEKISHCISAYNKDRPHASCNYLTPEQAHSVSGILNKRWKDKTKSKTQNEGCITQPGIVNSVYN
jgi:putative transposase